MRYEIYSMRGVVEWLIQASYSTSAINHVNHELTNIKWLIVAPWPTLSCALTLDSVC